MSKPTPGKQHRTLEGETPSTISAQAYGNPNQYPLIIDTNATQTPLTATGVIPTGTVLIIPFDNDLESLRKRQLRRGLRL